MKCPRCGKDNPADVHTCTPLALKLADDLMEAHRGHADEGPSTFSDAAAELRRLHAENEALREALQEMYHAFNWGDMNQGEALAMDKARAALAGEKT